MTYYNNPIDIKVQANTFPRANKHAYLRDRIENVKIQTHLKHCVPNVQKYDPKY